MSSKFSGDFLRVFLHTTILPVIMDNVTLSSKVIPFFLFVILSDRLEFPNKCYIIVAILVYFYFKGILNRVSS